MPRPQPAPSPRNRILLLLLLLACVGLMSAVGHKRLRRLQIESSRPPEPIELVNVSTQVMSFRVGEDTNNPPEPHHSLLMSAAPPKPPAPIIQSTPNTFVQKARREYEGPPSTNTPVSIGRPQEIVSD